MNKLSIRYLFPEDPDALSLFESLNELQETIRQRAFGLFSERGTVHGSDTEDWLRAERELVWMPQSETMEDDKQFRLRLIVPGLEAQDLQITAMPDAIIVQAEGASKEANEAKDRSVAIRAVFLGTGLASAASDQLEQKHPEAALAHYKRAMLVYDPPNPLYDEMRSQIAELVKGMEPEPAPVPAPRKTAAKKK